MYACKLVWPKGATPRIGLEWLGRGIVDVGVIESRYL